MKIVSYNIAYFSGLTGKKFHYVSKFHKMLFHSKKKMNEIIDFLKKENPDVVGLIEIDGGSLRTLYKSQPEKVERQMKYNMLFNQKYGENKIKTKIPILKKQGNAFITRKRIEEYEFFSLPAGFKRLVIRIRYEGIQFYLVHLALSKMTRSIQIDFLRKKINKEDKNIVLGDFNTFNGEMELRKMVKECGLKNPNEGEIPTQPSCKPKYILDYILVSKGIKVKKFTVPSLQYSDHLPVIVEIFTKEKKS